MSSSSRLPQYLPNTQQPDIPHRFVLWTRSLFSNSPVPIPTPIFAPWITSRIFHAPKMIEPSPALPQTTHNQADPTPSAFKQSLIHEIAQLKRVSPSDAIPSSFILLLTSVLTILWHADPTPCDLGSAFFWSQNLISTVLGIFWVERYLNAIGVPDGCRVIIAVLVTGFVYLGQWHLRVKSGRDH